MTSYLLAGPATEPVSLADAKGWLKIDSDDEDDLIAALIAAARLHVESVTGRALIAQSWRLVLDAWPDNRVVRLPVSPLLTLTAITATDRDGMTHEVSLDDVDAGRAELLLLTDIDAPTLREHNGIAIDYVAGFGETGDDVPAPLKQALLLVMAYWFEHRDTVFGIGEGPAVPMGFDALVAPWRVVRL